MGGLKKKSKKEVRKGLKVVKRKIVKPDDYEMTDEQEKSTARVTKRKLDILRRKKEKELKKLKPDSARWKRKKREIENLRL